MSARLILNATFAAAALVACSSTPTAPADAGVMDSSLADGVASDAADTSLADGADSGDGDIDCGAGRHPASAGIGDQMVALLGSWHLIAIRNASGGDDPLSDPMCDPSIELALGGAEGHSPGDLDAGVISSSEAACDVANEDFIPVLGRTDNTDYPACAVVFCSAAKTGVLWDSTSGTGLYGTLNPNGTLGQRLGTLSFDKKEPGHLLFDIGTPWVMAPAMHAGACQ